MKYLKCVCPHCANNIEYPTRGAGLMFDCPHCGQRFTFPRRFPMKSLILGIAAVALPLGILLSLSFVATGSGKPGSPEHDKIRAAMDAKMARVLAKMEAQQATNKTLAGPEDHSAVKIGEWKYAGDMITGYITNRTHSRLDWVTVHIGIYNGDRVKLGNATDTILGLRPGEAWQFKAQVFEDDGKRAVLEAVTCELGRLY